MLQPFNTPPQVVVTTNHKFFIVGIFRCIYLHALLQPLDVILQAFLMYEYLLLLNFNPVQVKIRVSYLIQSLPPDSAWKLLLL